MIVFGKEVVERSGSRGDVERSFFYCVWEYVIPERGSLVCLLGTSGVDRATMR